MNRFVWIDTSFFYALFVVKDQYHASAQAIWNACIKKQIVGVTSNLILGELGTLLVYHFDHIVALNQLNKVLDSQIIKKIYVDQDIQSSALLWWKRFADQSFSLPDCVSFELMKRTGIKQAFSFDADFTIAGFQLVKTPHLL